jgi:hypothetical protein
VSVILVLFLLLGTLEVVGQLLQPLGEEGKAGDEGNDERGKHDGRQRRLECLLPCEAAVSSTQPAQWMQQASVNRARSHVPKMATRNGWTAFATGCRAPCQPPAAAAEARERASTVETSIFTCKSRVANGKAG